MHHLISPHFDDLIEIFKNVVVKKGYLPTFDMVNSKGGEFSGYICIANYLLKIYFCLELFSSHQPKIFWEFLVFHDFVLHTCV